MAKIAGECGEVSTDNGKKTAADKIFDTARELFYRRGVRAVGVDEIVCEAGVTKPSLYRAFKSKDALITACLEESGREGRDAIHAVLATAGGDPRARMDAVLRHFADKLNRPDYRGCPMSNVAVEFPEAAHPARTLVQEWKSDIRSTFLCLARGLKVADPAALADGLVLVIEGAIASHHVFGRQGPAHAMMQTCNALIEASLPAS